MYVFAGYVHLCIYPSACISLRVYDPSCALTSPYACSLHATPSVRMSPPCVCSFHFYVSLFGCFFIFISTPCMPSVRTSLLRHVPSLCMCSERLNDHSAYMSPSACVSPAQCLCLSVFLSSRVCPQGYVCIIILLVA